MVSVGAEQTGVDVRWLLAGLVGAPVNTVRCHLSPVQGAPERRAACKSPGPAAFRSGVLGVVAGTGRLVVVAPGEEVQGCVCGSALVTGLVGGPRRSAAVGSALSRWGRVERGE